MDSSAQRLPDLRLLVNADGEIVGAERATISAMDHGFLYGDSVYETLRSYHRRPFLLERHLARLERSMGRIFLEPPCSMARFREEIERTLDAHGEAFGTDGETALRVVVTRGPGPIGLDFTLCDSPRFLIYAFPVPRVPERYFTEGIAVVVSQVRRNHPSALDPGIKSGNFLNNILAYKDAKRCDAQEAILLNADGYVAEGATSNIFMVRDGVVLTPRSFGILDGITRAAVLEDAAAAGIAVDERDIPSEELLAANEAFITSSVRGIMPVARVNAAVVGDGRPGEITRRLVDLYEARVERECGG